MASLPDGYFSHGLLLFGTDLSKETYIAKGLRLDLPDIRNSDAATKILLKDQANYLLAALGDDYALQVKWTVENDYYAPLERYRTETEKYCRQHPWSYAMRAERQSRYRNDMHQGVLRRERLNLYLARRCDTLRESDVLSTERLESFVKQQARNFEERLNYIQSIFTFARGEAMGDVDHFLAYKKFFNPSLLRQIAVNADLIKEGFRPDQSINANALSGDGVPFHCDREKLTGLCFDDHYHALFVIREWPKHTEPGIMHALTNAVAMDFDITQNIYPCNLEAEIKLLEEQRAELLKQVSDPKKFHLHAEIERKGKKITAFMMGHTLPFKVLTIVRVWDRTVDGLAAKCLAIKGAFQRLSGCRYHQVNHEAQAKNLFFETIPGHLGGATRAWDKDAENTYLSDLLPLSSTFNGHIDEPQILLDSPQGSLVGLRLFSGDTPQHACLVGMRGAGKSSVTMEVLSQTDHLSGFTGIIEEGLAYGTYAQLNGFQSLVLRPGSDYTWNYFDTMGLPLSPAVLADATALCVKLIGVSRDEDVNKLRGALVTEYIDALYNAAAEDWQNADDARYYDMVRRACVIERYRRKMPQGSAFLDAFVDLRDLERENPERWEKLLREPCEADVIAFAKKRETASLVRDLIFSRFTPEEFPTHSALCSIMKSGRMAHHKGEDMRRELDMIVTLLSKWKAVGGLYGPFVDGVTNIKVNGKGLHVELGYLGESNRELKEVAGFLATSKMRQMIVNLPRAVPKRMIYEEVSKFLTVPGAPDILAENYAQFRKYMCWVLTCFQNCEQLDRVDPALLKTIRANSTQFWFMRHQDAASLATLGDPIGLPIIARQDICRYPLPEHQRGEKKATFFTLFSKETGTPVCGTVRVEVNPHMLYVASSNGNTFDQRQKAIAQYENPIDGVFAEVDKRFAARAQKLNAA
jgi:hypothetical protein